MTLEEVLAIIDGKVVSRNVDLSAQVDMACGADLMSDVLAFSRSGAVLITGLASVQSVHTADVADLKAIVFVHSKRPAEPVADVARHQGIPLLTTGRFMFETCGLLFSHGLKPADKA